MLASFDVSSSDTGKRTGLQFTTNLNEIYWSLLFPLASILNAYFKAKIKTDLFS